MAKPGTSYRETMRDRLPDRTGAWSPAVLLPALLITFSELALLYDRIDLALWGHFLTLLGCVFAPLVLDDEPMLQAFALVPVFRLINLGMPVFVELTIYWLPLVYGPLFPAIYVVATRSDTPAILERPRRAALGLLPAIALGALLAELEYAVIRPDALVPAWTPANVAVVVVVMFVFVGAVEELLYRGILQPPLQRRVGRAGGILVASALYGMMHAAYGSPAEIVLATGIGALLGVIYDVTESMTLVTVIHGSLNVFLFAVIPLQGSLLGG